MEGVREVDRRDKDLRICTFGVSESRVEAGEFVDVEIDLLDIESRKGRGGENRCLEPCRYFCDGDMRLNIDLG